MFVEVKRIKLTKCVVALCFTHRDVSNLKVGQLQAQQVIIKFPYIYHTSWLHDNKFVIY